MATPVGGLKRFTVEGNAYDVSELGGFSILKAKRETVPVVAGTSGHKVNPAIPYVEVTISTRGIRVSDLIGAEGVTAQLDLQNGKSYVWPDAHEVGDGQDDRGAVRLGERERPHRQRRVDAGRGPSRPEAGEQHGHRGGDVAG
jgi:hypothetical protein